MTAPFERPIAEALRFNPKWWWDPVPDFYLRFLDEDRLQRLIKVQLDFQRAALNAELKALKQTAEILGQ
jgi:hypothetical protein